MLVVKIELWPATRGADAERYAQEIGRMYIANDGTSSDPKRGDYTAAVCRRGITQIPSTFNGRGYHPARTGEVKNYPRLSYNVWRLVARALKACFPEER